MLTRLDRYLIRQCGLSFAFFALVFTGVIWLTQSVRLIETVIASGQPAIVFVEFAMLVLPTVLAIVLPLSCFAAALYVINKLYGESELVVMMMSGQSPAALARPIALFGLFVGLITLALMLFAVPFGVKRLSERQFDIRTELARALIVEGRFLYPVPGVTLYIRDTSTTGEMAGIFLHDAREAGRPVTYSASRAFLLRDGDSARLVMARGVALTYEVAEETLRQVRFDEFIYDLSGLLTDPGRRRRRPEEFWIADLFAPSEEMLAAPRYSRGDYVAVGHEKITTSLLAFVLPLVGLGVMLRGGYSRRGFGKRVFYAALTGVLVISFTFFSKSLVARLPDAWPLAYLPVLAALALSSWLLAGASTTAARPAAPA